MHISEADVGSSQGVRGPGGGDRPAALLTGHHDAAPEAMSGSLSVAVGSTQRRRVRALRRQARSRDADQHVSQRGGLGFHVCLSVQ